MEDAEDRDDLAALSGCRRARPGSEAGGHIRDEALPLSIVSGKDARGAEAQHARVGDAAVRDGLGSRGLA
eukprot:4788260-Alexandrium_andersonii.AAC.1